MKFSIFAFEKKISLYILHGRVFVIIMKTCPCNVYPLKPQFYREKLGFAGVYLFSLFLLQNIDCGYSCTHNVCFEWKYLKNKEKFPMKFSIFAFEKNISVYIAWACFCNYHENLSV